MTRLGVLSSKAIAFLALMNLGVPAYAESASDCLETALRKMVGKFSATGKQLNAEGDLTDFQNIYEARAVAVGELLVLLSDKPVAVFQFENGAYTFITLDDDEKPLHDPIPISFQCSLEPKSGRVLAVEEWEILPNGTGPVWHYRQTRTIGDDEIAVTLEMRDGGSELPFMVVNEFVASRF
ncbi:hypothetical protein [Sinorhizobium medicae]|uniref:hypothetical protein n=1 Tax=Sinorhizobium medicae TaxID=110321 RepID=UPI000C7D591A|nr:hypothetical protein [Sinorhizobium medicae]PLU02970.1 hypothetical protein BMJ32_11025 [Sinorhizobium medicae]PLU57735.1 hypothetical protein BMJ23_07350 [Sinorhizobium medicae]PLU72542.1 hypothetical protein BMJ21_07565 [Sinorhizobium medicae]PLU83835.1 hypothetical protein BMJ22_01705 [Sinorhizobium medicae]